MFITVYSYSWEHSFPLMQKQIFDDVTERRFLSVAHTSWYNSAHLHLAPASDRRLRTRRFHRPLSMWAVQV